MEIIVGKYITIIDNEDYSKFIQHKWYTKPHANGTQYIHCRKPKMYLHRYLLEVTDSKIQVDHKNMNPLDNRKENLRICPSGAFNAINRPKQKNNTSGYKGVFKREEYKNPCYRAMIRVNQKLIRLGQFKTAEEAAIAYNEAAIRYFGEFAYLNEIKK